jgi:hypothetical protein
VGVAGPPSSKSVTSAVGTAPTLEPVTVTSLDTANDMLTIPLLDRLLFPAKHKVSKVTLDCLKRLRYTPAAQFCQKAAAKDVSETLEPVELFVDIFTKSLKQVNMTSEMGQNEAALRCFIIENLPEIRAPRELTNFFNDWNIKVILFEPEGAEFNAHLATALEASKATAQAEATQRQTKSGTHLQLEKDKEAEVERKVFLQELDVISCAIRHRLTRWATTFPQRTLADQLWTSTFSTEDRKTLRNYVAKYVDDNDFVSRLTTRPGYNSSSIINYALILLQYVCRPSQYF